MGVRRNMLTTRSYVAASDVTANLPVRDGHAEDADRHDAHDRDEVVPAVDRAPLAEPGEREDRECAAGEAAEMPPDRDAGDGEREGEVDDDQRERTAAEHV